MTKRSTLGWGTVGALGLLLVGLIVICNYALAGWQLDLTENHLYTLSRGTDRILKSIPEPIDLYFFYSRRAAENIPQLRAYGDHVENFLRELAARADGKIRLHIIDPRPYSVEEDRAAELGVSSAPLNSAGSKFYLGLAGTNSTNGHQAIPFFDPSKQRFLEYDVDKLIYRLVHPHKPVVAWYSSLPMTGGFNAQTEQVRQPWLVYSQARQLYDLRTLAPGATRIPADTRVLVLVDPHGLPAATRFAIDQYALAGGHIVAFVDPLAESAGGGPGAPPQGTGPKFAHLLASWGVRFNPDQVVADRSLALTVSGPNGAPSVDPLVIGLGRKQMSQHDVITAGLSNINLDAAGALSPIKGAGTTFKPLLWSSKDAEVVNRGSVAGMFDPSGLLTGFKPTGKRYVFAARVTGKVKTAFPDGPPKGIKLPPGTTPLKNSVKPLHLIVFADSDMLADFLWVHHLNLFGQPLDQAWAANGDVVLNALDNMAGSDDLISVRAKAGFSRPFTRVQALRRAAQARYHAEQVQLQKELHRTERQLTLLQSSRNAKTTLILTPAQQREIQHFEHERLTIRKRLRAVQAGLVRSIDRLGTELKVINIIVVPGVFALAALLGAALRRRHRRAAHQTAREHS